MTYEITIGEAPATRKYTYRHCAHIATWRAWQNSASTKAAQFARNLKHQYGITVEAYNDILTAQNGVCAGCGTPPTTRRLDIDHCHDTKRIRGILCMNCNLALGRVKDSIPTLKNLIRYLEERGCE